MKSVPLSDHDNPGLKSEDIFGPDHRDAYLRWRDAKLRDYPRRVEELFVEIKNPGNLTRSEIDKIKDLVKKTGMAIYISPSDEEGDREAIQALGYSFGLTTLDRNLFSDGDGLTALAVSEGGDNREFIPYTNREIHWHTDGYYNDEDSIIRGLVLHCVRQAPEGGENALMDPEIVYIRLRDKNPDLIRALMQRDAMTIPEHRSKGELVRPEISVPVYFLDSENLGMRYTQRKRNIRWKDDPSVREAVVALNEILSSDDPFLYRARLISGMGLVSNNVLHDRSSFRDNPEKPRLLFRGRYYERIAGT